MIPMNGVLRGLCSAVLLCTWLTTLSLIRASGPWTLKPSEKLLLEVKLLVELDIFILLDGEPEEPELVREAGCRASPQPTGPPWLGGATFTAAEAWDRSLSAVFTLLGRGYAAPLSLRCSWTFWLGPSRSPKWPEPAPTV